MILLKFVDELPIPAVLKPIRSDSSGTYYKVSMTQFSHSFHRDLNDTTVWGYQGTYPGPTIEAESGERVYVKWLNLLPEKHLFPVDYTVHGAHPDVPEVRTVVHLHGASVESPSDGYPEAWFTNDFKETGPHFTKKVYQYDNNMRACTLWYHDHTLGITRLNVYAGLAGFYLIRDKYERKLNLPCGPYEIPLIIQDKSFNPDGSLYYPKQERKPVPELETSVVSAFFGDAIVVNGKVWPYLDVEPRKYRFRMLNGSNTRFYRLKLDSGQTIYQIGTDGGLVKHPVGLKEILIAPAERSDVIIDFTNLDGQKIIMRNDAPYPFPTGAPPHPDTVGTVMEFRVTLPLSSIDTSVIPWRLSKIPRMIEEYASKTRYLTLTEGIDRFGRDRMLLDNKSWDAPITEKPRLGATEIWALINLTNETHPIHLHLVDFQILDRRTFDVEQFKADGQIRYTGPTMPPTAQEKGWKDTVIVYPGQVARIIMTFGPYAGLYVWHCHILEHEDYEMMRPYVVVLK